MILKEGELIKDRYRLLSFRGRGSFGEVWLARDEFLDMDVALKIYISLDRKGIDEFRSEYKVTFALNHPNLLHISYFDFLDQRPYLVMPYCPTSSESLIGNISEEDAWRFIRDVSSGLAYLHSKNIIHRDIKPDNILRNEQGDFLISDFGITVKMRSTLRRASTRNINDSKDTAGSLAYMGPELFSSNPTPVMATDIWALGATLYEMLEGELPFFGQGGVLLLNGAENPDIPGNWSQSLKATVSACLSRDTWERPKAEEISHYSNNYIKGAISRLPWEDSWEIRKKEEERKRKEAEERRIQLEKQRIEEERQRLLAEKRAEEERLRIIAEEKAAEEERKRIEAERKRQEELARQREEAERKRKEEERLKKEAEERRKAELAKQKEEEERWRREEERLRKEQEAKRKAELARQKEEAERKKREEAERLRLERERQREAIAKQKAEAERKRLEEAQRLREEKERKKEAEAKKKAEEKLKARQEKEKAAEEKERLKEQRRQERDAARGDKSKSIKILVYSLAGIAALVTGIVLYNNMDKGGVIDDPSGTVSESVQESSDTQNQQDEPNDVTISQPAGPQVESTIRVSSINLDKPHLSMKVGEHASLNVTILPADATEKTLSWTSSNPSIASVSSGTITAKASGKTVVSVKTKDGRNTASCTITVEDNPIDEETKDIDPLDEAISKKDWSTVEGYAKNGNSKAKRAISSHYLSIARANLNGDESKQVVSHNYAVKLYNLGYKDEAKEIVQSLNNMGFYDFNEKGISKPNW